jgi:uncharacterized protein YehS (DUF1456 family)
VIDAMLAIRRRFDAAPEDLIALVDGARVPLARPGVTAFVRAPDAALVHDRLAAVLSDNYISPAHCSA